MISEEDLVRHIDTVLQELRPNIQMDGGDVEFVSFKDGVVAIRLTGSCSNCSFSQDCIRADIEARLRDALPDMHEVILMQ